MPQNKSIRKPTTPIYKAEDYYYSVAWSDEDEAFIGRVAEFPSLAAHGDTLPAALQEILVVVEGALEDMEESGEIMPMPFSKRSYSGRLNVRMPEHLHRRLAIEAEQQGVSLNRWINTKLETPIE
jgi:predicted HicB family RNase H-like nuclease